MNLKDDHTLSLQLQCEFTRLFVKPKWKSLQFRCKLRGSMNLELLAPWGQDDKVAAIATAAQFGPVGGRFQNGTFEGSIIDADLALQNETAVGLQEVSILVKQFTMLQIDKGPF